MEPVQNSTPASPDTVLEFWFGALVNGMAAPDHRRRWFTGGATFDGEIRARFAVVTEAALAGELEHWAQTASGRLALVLVLDQFPRNIFRGDCRAFAGDPMALRLVRQGLELGIDRQLAFDPRCFFYLPLEHSECLVDQDLCVTLFASLLQESTPAQQVLAADSLRWAREHRNLVARFGRFPHRNRVLGRESTDAELAYLEDGERFGQ